MSDKKAKNALNKMLSDLNKIGVKTKIEKLDTISKEEAEKASKELDEKVGKKIKALGIKYKSPNDGYEKIKKLLKKKEQ